VMSRGGGAGFFLVGWFPMLLGVVVWKKGKGVVQTGKVGYYGDVGPL